MRHRRRAMSLVEVLIAMSIFITAFMSLLGIFPASLNSIRQARELEGGTFLAERVIESCRAADFNALGASLPNPNPRQDTIVTRSNNQVSSLTYVTTVAVTPTPAASPTSKQVVVQVTWVSGGLGSSGGQLRTVRLSTEVAAP